MEKICSICKKKFEIPYWKRKQKFCSIGCQIKWQKESKIHLGKNSPRWVKKVKRICQYCKKEFCATPVIIKNGGGKFCSKNCRNRFQENQRVKKKCLFCGKDFEVINSHKETKFCSVECMGKWYSKNRIGEKSANWKGGPIEKKCLICDKVFYRKLNEVKRGNVKFCSNSCRNIWLNKYIIKKKDTSIELAIEVELIEQHIPYLKQAPIEGIALVDFLLPNKIIVQCDGDYWHNLQNYKDRDTNQDFLLNFKGYKVYRFWQHEINKSAKRCINKVLKEQLVK